MPTPTDLHPGWGVAGRDARPLIQGRQTPLAKEDLTPSGANAYRDHCQTRTLFPPRY